MKVRHVFLGPVAHNYVGAYPTAWQAACTCGWRHPGPYRITRTQSREDFRKHVEEAQS